MLSWYRDLLIVCSGSAVTWYLVKVEIILAIGIFRSNWHLILACTFSFFDIKIFPQDSFALSLLLKKD